MLSKSRDQMGEVAWTTDVGRIYLRGDNGMDEGEGTWWSPRAALARPQWEPQRSPRGTCTRSNLTFASLHARDPLTSAPKPTSCSHIHHATPAACSSSSLPIPLGLITPLLSWKFEFQLCSATSRANLFEKCCTVVFPEVSFDETDFKEPI